jgi:hypothetical protein
MQRIPLSKRPVIVASLLAVLAGCSGEAPRADLDDPPEAAPPRTGRDPKKEAVKVESPATTTKASKAEAGKSAKTVRPEPTKTETAKKETPRTAKTARPRGTIIDALLKDLRDDDLRKVEAAFWRLASISKEHIPALIREVESTESTKITRIKAIILEKDFVGERKHLLATRVHGLGKMEDLDEEDGQTVVRSKDYTDISYGIKNKKYQMVIDRVGGFPLGIVIRAGLINRFLSTRYPGFTDDDPAPGKLVAWWKAYYDLSKDRL